MKQDARLRATIRRRRQTAATAPYPPPPPLPPPPRRQRSNDSRRKGVTLVPANAESDSSRGRGLKSKASFAKRKPSRDPSLAATRSKRPQMPPPPGLGPPQAPPRSEPEQRGVLFNTNFAKCASALTNSWHRKARLRRASSSSSTDPISAADSLENILANQQASLWDWRDQCMAEAQEKATRAWHGPSPQIHSPHPPQLQRLRVARLLCPDLHLPAVLRDWLVPDYFVSIVLDILLFADPAQTDVGIVGCCCVGSHCHFSRTTPLHARKRSWAVAGTKLEF